MRTNFLHITLYYSTTVLVSCTSTYSSEFDVKLYNRNDFQMFGKSKRTSSVRGKLNRLKLVPIPPNKIWTFLMQHSKGFMHFEISRQTQKKPQTLKYTLKNRMNTWFRPSTLKLLEDTDWSSLVVTTLITSEYRRVISVNNADFKVITYNRCTIGQ